MVDDEVLHWDFEPTQTLGATTITCKDIGIMVWCLREDESAEGNKEQTMSLMFVKLYQRDTGVQLAYNLKMVNIVNKLHDGQIKDDLTEAPV